MPARKKKVDEKLHASLKARLQSRKNKQGTVWVLDFRCQQFEVLCRNTLLLRNPRDEGWPDAGRTTSERKVAESWLEAYTPVIATRMAQREQEAIRGRGPLTVAVACDRYLEALERQGASEHTYKNRRASIRVHIRPKLGYMALADLDTKRVRDFLDAVRIRKPGTGKERTSPASTGYKRDLRACLRAIFRECLPDTPIPFEGLFIKGESDSAKRRRAALEGDMKTLLTPKSGALTRQQIRQTLVAAAWYDRYMIEARANMLAWAVPNTALAIAFAIALGTRVEELVLLRWQNIKEDEGAILIPGPKSRAGVRYVPLQKTLRPWIALLRERARPKGARADWTPDPMAFLFTTNAKTPGRMGSRRTLQSRFTTAVTLAGAKVPKKATHWARATFVNLLRRKVSAEELKAYTGHAQAYGGATDDYLAAMLESMPAVHRELIDCLPGPAEVVGEAEGFRPHGATACGE